ncbi:hypothetical protein C8F01DRAFT_386407 [Mycena amicta]|nr:hypothetical protein C8F01DRAFT_386407 [Mycena amicta]
MMNSGKPEQITATKHQDQDEDDPRNFEHVNLSGSFILQSTSCCDIKSQNEDIQPLPALVLTFPTPEPPTLSRFAASSGFQRDTINLTVPNLPRCSHCGFGFALDFHNLEVPQKHKPCRFCEPQWLACKTWYEGEKIMQSAESREHSAALKLTGDDRRALGPEVVDEHGQVHEKPTEIHAKAVGEGYSRFSNVIIKDKSASRAITVWRKVARLFASQARTERKESSERGRRRWWGRGTGTKENHD